MALAPASIFQGAPAVRDVFVSSYMIFCCCQIVKNYYATSSLEETREFVSTWDNITPSRRVWCMLQYIDRGNENQFSGHYSFDRPRAKNKNKENAGKNNFIFQV